MGKMSRNKGAAGEREFIRAVDRLTNGAVRLSRNLEQSRQGGDDLVGCETFSFEIKRHRKVTDSDISQWWKQAVGNAGHKHPALAYRPDFQHWRVVVHPPYEWYPVDDVRGCITMDLELFCRLLMNHQILQCFYEKTG